MTEGLLKFPGFYEKIGVIGTPSKTFTVSSSSPGYDPFLYYINQLYLQVETIVQSRFTLGLFLKVLVVFICCCVLFLIIKRFFATASQGEWSLDTSVLGKYLLGSDTSPEEIEEFTQHFKKGVTNFSLSNNKMTLTSGDWSIDFRYEQISRNGQITTGLLDGKMVVMILTPKTGSPRIISLRKASDHEMSYASGNPE